jgi:hypothetical protein
MNCLADNLAAPPYPIGSARAKACPADFPKRFAYRGACLKTRFPMNLLGVVAKIYALKSQHRTQIIHQLPGFGQIPGRCRADDIALARPVTKVAQLEHDITNSDGQIGRANRSISRRAVQGSF